jgi:diaminohydroxyphosphoribosylaminopyrimidine deaminase/5-amino-6-(5-phosphoribosylamino)uracil reductase
MVGAVIVRHEKGQRALRGERPLRGQRALRVVGEGYHHQPGLPHAEIIALEQAGANAFGGTLYTNLEPCCHTKKRTPPCTNAILKSGISRVVVAMRDPNKMVNGRGIQILREAGVSVTCDLMRDQAMRLNEVFVKRMTQKLPFVILKAAMTLDGKIATKTGASRWITSDAARREVHQLRSRVDAVLVGIGTVLADDPELLAYGKTKNPMRVVIDPNLKIPIQSRLVTTVSSAPTLVMTTVSAASKKASLLAQAGVLIESFPKKVGGIPFQAILKRLMKKGIASLLIEGGGRVNGRALREGVVDRVIFFIAPKFLCGNDAKAVVEGKSVATLADAVSLRDMTIRKVGDDLCVEGYIKQ